MLILLTNLQLCHPELYYIVLNAEASVSQLFQGQALIQFRTDHLLFHCPVASYTWSVISSSFGSNTKPMALSDYLVLGKHKLTGNENVLSLALPERLYRSQLGTVYN